VQIGRLNFDASSRVGSVVLWLLQHERELSASELKLTVTWGKGGIKYSVENWYRDSEAAS
jgi:hypothetical protein